MEYNSSDAVELNGYVLADVLDLMASAKVSYESRVCLVKKNEMEPGVYAYWPDGDGVNLPNSLADALGPLGTPDE